MSSFSFMPLDAIQELLSEIMDTLDQLHTVSIEFTVLREKSLPIGLEIHIQCLLAEQKPQPTLKEKKILVEKLKKQIKEWEETVTTNC